MNWKLNNLFGFPAYKKTTILLLSVVFFFVSAQSISAQKKFSKSYPASKNVRLQLLNRSGSVTVEGWNKSEVAIVAALESPAANIEPKNQSGTIIIDLVEDNKGRTDVGNVNFTIKVPYSSTVDIATLMGNLVVRDIGGGFVRARISSEGDIELTNISSAGVIAENGIGNIFFDGDLKAEGMYRFTSTKGNINIRIPLNSSFRLVAIAPSSRISLGPFTTAGLNFSDARRVFGKVGDGNASMTVKNQRGSIAFTRR
jgi:hypothetical protein